jgi:branched-chain amino acid transport system substrate-binding protein
MRKRIALACALTAIALSVTLLTVGNAFGGRKADTILIGIAAAKTGILAPYDLQAGQLFQMRIKQINKAGGVLGKQIDVNWIDTKSDKPTAANAANELISKGAVFIVDTCDFDYSFPATNAAHAKNIPSLALCASSPKAATPGIVGPYAGSMGLGSDTEGSTMAEWMHAKKPQWKRVYVFKDTSLEYSKATADYFKARFEALGGKICGEDTFVGSSNLDLSAQITRLRGAVKNCDAIFDGSWQPYGSQLIKAVRDAGINIPITTNASVNGVLVKQVAGNVSNFYAEGFACLPTYCRGTQTPQVRTIAAQFRSTYGQVLGNHYALPGYALADAVVAAIKKAGTTDGPKIAQALFGGGVTVNYFGTTMKFTNACHRPQPAAYSIEQWTGGNDTQIDHWKVQSVPDIGDGSPCSGKPPAAG